ncbi:helix-turn-helix domain-containing protein [Methylorubrum suomiense]|uniref:helix-turn-helix domain-containing protein n=1 Tax=Methylorubrum suomiense TaxID=144191 RepID=UPI003570EA39
MSALSLSAADGEDEVFTAAEVATRWKCSASFVRRLIDNGELPAFRVGGKLLRITARAVREYEACRNTSSKNSAAGTPSASTKGASASAAEALKAATQRERRRSSAESLRTHPGR